MGPHQVSSRKAALLEQIIEYMRDRSISNLSFRTLAAALSVSTFTLVYHFGSRTELVNQIVGSIVTTQKGKAGTDEEPTTFDEYVDRIRASFDWIVLPQYRHLERLELESSIANSLDPEAITFTRDVYGGWVESSVIVLRSFGISELDAQIHARFLANIFYGSQYDIVINDDEVATRAAFAVALDGYRDQVERLIADATQTTGASAQQS